MGPYREREDAIDVLHNMMLRCKKNTLYPQLAKAIDELKNGKEKWVWFKNVEITDGFPDINWDDYEGVSVVIFSNNKEAVVCFQ